MIDMEKEMYLWTQIEVEVINMRTKITPHRLIQMQYKETVEVLLQRIIAIEKIDKRRWRFFHNDKCLDAKS